MLNPVAKLHVVASSSNGHPDTTSALVDLQAGIWRNYSTGVPLSHPSKGLRIRIGGNTGLVEIGSVTLTRVADKAVFRHITEHRELQSLTCSGGMVPLPGGESARFFLYGPEPELLLPETGLDSAFSVDVWMRWMQDLSALAAYVQNMRRVPTEPANVAALRAELWAHQAERVALAADYRRLKSSEQSTRSALARAEESARAEQELRRQAEQELSQRHNDAERMKFDYSRLMAEGHERDTLTAELARLRAELTHLSEQVPELQRALVGLRRENDELRRSYSWKITGPLRAALRLVRTGSIG
jgi:DNA repair exonuclease SbcCD ATPase subunit